MYATLDDLILADLLPGDWTVAATNFPLWLNGENHHPRLRYELLGRDPLVLTDEVIYLTAEGEQRVSGRNVEDFEGFTRRGTGWLRFFASRWSVAGVSADGTVIAIRFSKSTPDSMEPSTSSLAPNTPSNS